MTTKALNDSLQPVREATSLAARSGLVIFCLAAGIGYRVLVGLFPPGLLQVVVLLILAAALLLLAVLARRSQNLTSYWEIPFAFFVFTLAGILSDQAGFLQQLFVRNVLHEAPSANNPLATTVIGTVLAQLVSTACLVVPILFLTKASGSDLKSIFIDKTRNRWALLVGIGGFLVFLLYTASGRAQRFFPNAGVTLSHFLTLSPALVVLVLCNGLREAFWF